MDYAQQQRSPTKHLVGITFVVILHVLMGYALVSGLARKVVEQIVAPLDTKIIEEIKPPPPPEVLPPPPPKMVQVMPTFVPPPEVQIQSPITPPPVISQTTATPPPVFAPPAPPAPPTPPAPVAAAPVAAPSVGVACPNSQQVRTEVKYPPQARKDGTEGEVMIEFTVAASGEIKDVDIKSSSNRVFNNVSIAAVRQFKCNAQGRDVRVQVPFSFKLAD
jgi:periplasmic protein TonB